MKGPLRDAVEYGALRAVEGVLSALPSGAARRTGRGLGRVARAAGVRRAVVEDQLVRAFPERSDAWIERTVRACYSHFGEEVAALVRLGRSGPEELIERTADTEEIRRVWEGATGRGVAPGLGAGDSGRGGLIVTGHLGNWELAGAAVAGSGIPISAVVKGIRNERVDRHLTELRGRLGIETIDMAEASRGVAGALDRGRAVALVADQDARESGVFVPFLGRPASTYRGPALLALRHRVPLLFGLLVREGDGWRASLEPVWEPDGEAEPQSDGEAEPRRDGEGPSRPTGERVDDPVRSLTRGWVAALERAVRARPEQYFWFHRRWKTRPPDPSPTARVDRGR